ncbi:MAG: 2-C-methyl-D-erythritol 4-phosphate cytidylyltransferase [bacterium]|nr:2-C-methyl-D-erythritol 4-phosphate cytidylyltransferase [bacterium]
MKKTVAIILAAGKGTRMGTKVAKQYIEVDGKPLLYYTIKAFEESAIDEIILVVGKDEGTYCKENVTERYEFTKVSRIVEGGKERYNSVYEGLKAAGICSYVLIHDGARPCLAPDLINKMLKEVCLKKACVVGVPVKDTIKVIDADGQVVDTPDRSTLMITQTPQAFEYDLIIRAYEKLFTTKDINVTDDAMVVETMLKEKVFMVKGNYQNIKVTTPEDLFIVKQFLKYVE